jgi:hypothetical protein
MSYTLWIVNSKGWNPSEEEWNVCCSSVQVVDNDMLKILTS